MPSPIQVKLEITVDKLKPLTETATFSVDALFQYELEITAGEVKEVQIMPPGLKQPAFILVKPVTEISSLKPLPGKAALEYATFKAAGDKQGQRKPITGTHVFYNGMAEWVTDMTDAGNPGPLKSLIFWNNVEGEKKSMPIKVLLIVGYTPIAC